MVDIVIDVTVDLPKKVIEKYGIKVVPLYVIRDGDKIPIFYNSKNEFYKKFREEWLSGKLKTSQPTLKDFLEVYESCEKEILVFTISSELSGTYNVALNASKFTKKKVYVIDTRNASVGSGVLVLIARKLLEKYKVDEVVERIKDIRERIDTYAFVENINYLLNSGRINLLKYSFLKLVNKKPILNIRDGRLELFKLSSDLIKDFYDLEKKYKLKLYGSNTRKVSGKEILMNPIISIHVGPVFGFAGLR